MFYIFKKFAFSQVYGDITQNATEDELKSLLKRFNNEVPKVILFLEDKVHKRVN